jgi:hypothetical protein
VEDHHTRRRLVNIWSDHSLRWIDLTSLLFSGDLYVDSSLFKKKRRIHYMVQSLNRP